MLRFSPKIEIINHFDNLINRVDIDIEDCLEKCNSQAFGDNSALEYSRMKWFKKRWFKNYEDFYIKFHHESNNIDYEAINLCKQSKKDYLNHIRNRTIEELRKAQEDSLISYKLNSSRFKFQNDEKNIDEIKSELFADNFYFQVHFKQHAGYKSKLSGFYLFTFVTDFYMSSDDINSLQNLLNAEEEPFTPLSVPVFDEKMVLIGLLYNTLIENVLTFPNHVIRVRKQDVLNIKSINFRYNYSGVNLTCSSIDLSKLVKLNLYRINPPDRRDSLEIKLKGLTSIEKLLLEVNSDEVYLSLRNINSLKHLSLRSWPGMLNESFVNDICDQLQCIEELNLHGKLPYLNLDNLINLRKLHLQGSINEEFNFELFKTFYKQLELISIDIINVNYESLLKLFGAHTFSTLTCLKLLNCDMKIVEKKFINQFPMLKKLCLEKCNLEMIEDGALSNLKELLHLDLAENKFEKLEEKHFSQLVNLEFFSMCKNRLEFIDKNVFSNLRRLKYLDFRINKLTITNKSFIGLSRWVGLPIYVDTDDD